MIIVKDVTSSSGMTAAEIDLAIQCLNDIAAMKRGDIPLLEVDSLCLNSSFSFYEDNYLAYRLQDVVNRHMTVLLTEVYSELYRSLQVTSKSKKKSNIDITAMLIKDMYNQQINGPVSPVDMDKKDEQ